MRRCDFCSAPEARAAYPVESGATWAACEECRLLIDAGELLPFVRRIVLAFVRWRQAQGMASEHAGVWTLLEHALADALTDVFWSVRAGPPVPIERPMPPGWDPKTRSWAPD